MALPEDFLDELKGRIRLPDIIGKHVRLTRRGREYLGLCPFHNEKTPSFRVYDDHYHCFGCGAHGSAYDFVMQTENLGFTEAVARLATEVGLTLPTSSPEADAREKRSRTLHDALEAAAAYFEKMLRLPDGLPALKYLHDRGLSDASISRYRLGFAPDTRSALKAALNRAGFAEEAMVEAGLLVAPEAGDRPAYDRFRGRVMFPIADRRGRVVGFGGRILGEGEPKYLNTPETPLFQKGRLLYGLKQALEAVGKAGTLVVVEGYMDVIGLAQAGISHVVAPLGTALTEEQLRLLWRLVPEPILWFDPDVAGTRAAVRAAEAALPLIRRGFGLKFAFAGSDFGDDPADLVKRYGSSFVHRTLADAVPLSELIFRIARGHGRLDSAEERARLEDRLNRYADRMTDLRLRRHYRMLCRDRLRRELRSTASAQAGGARPMVSPVESSPVSLTAPQSNAERGLLEILLRYPAFFDEVEEQIGRLRFGDLACDGLRQAIIEALSGRQHPVSVDVLEAELRTRGHGELIDAILLPTRRVTAYPGSPPDREQMRELWRESVRTVEVRALRAQLVQDHALDLSDEGLTRRRDLNAARLQAEDG